MITEERICEVCGKPVIAGMTNDSGDFYCHEECFEKYMDDTYGKHRWMQVNDDGENGYYVAYGVTATDSKIETAIFGTGIYYTEWEE